MGLIGWLVTACLRGMGLNRGWDRKILERMLNVYYNTLDLYQMILTKSELKLVPQEQT